MKEFEKNFDQRRTPTLRRKEDRFVKAEAAVCVGLSNAHFSYYIAVGIVSPPKRAWRGRPKKFYSAADIKKIMKLTQEKNHARA